MPVEIVSLILVVIQTCIVAISTILLLYQLKQFDHSLRQDSYGKQLEFALRINEFLLQHPSIANQFNQKNVEYHSLNTNQQELYHYLILLFDVYERFYLLFLAKRLEKKRGCRGNDGWCKLFSIWTFSPFVGETNASTSMKISVRI